MHCGRGGINDSCNNVYKINKQLITLNQTYINEWWFQPKVKANQMLTYLQINFVDFF